MVRTLCKSKLHGATVTEANVHYAGSITIDASLMEAADLVPYEQVHVFDIDNGARLVTYCIEGPRGSGTMCMNGAAARLVSTGDRIIVVGFGQFEEEELKGFQPKIVMLDERNRIRAIKTDKAAEFELSKG
jgi:aspartate 1-decarboxylase